MPLLDYEDEIAVPTPKRAAQGRKKSWLRIAVPLLLLVAIGAIFQFF